jgi:HK97 family phage portal protein
LKLIDKIAGRLGYLKAAEAKKFIELVRATGFCDSSYGIPTQENFHKFQSQYGADAWVYACVYLIATTIAGLPWRLYRYAQSGGKWEKVYVTSPEIEAILERPSLADDNATWYNLIEFTLACQELTGNAYWYFEEVYGTGNKPKTIQGMLPSQIRIKPGKDTAGSMVGEYLFIRSIGDPIPIEKSRIVHFKYMSTSNYFYGQGSLTPGRGAIELIRESGATNLEHFRNGAKMDGILETDSPITDKSTIDRLRNQFAEMWGGKNRHSTAILPAGLKYKNIVASMKDLEYIEGIKLSREEVCAVFGVPPVLVGILDKATYSNYEQALRIFWVHTLIPKVKRHNDAITNIVHRFDKNLYFEFDTSSVDALKDDENRKSEIALRYFSMGIPLNEIIGSLGLPFKPVDGGDVGLIPLSLSPIDTAGDIPELPDAPAGAGQGAAPDQGDDDPDEQDQAGKADFRTKEEHRKRALWKSFAQLTTRIERKYREIISRHFMGIEIQVLSSIKENPAGGSILKDKINVDLHLFDTDAEARKWAAKNKKIHALSAQQAGNEALRELGFSLSFDLSNPRVAAWLDAYGLDKATSVMDTLHESLKNSLIEGVEAGESIADLRDRVKEAFGPYAEMGGKAEQIARTEVISAANMGQLEGYKQTGLTLGKGWIAQYDGRARETHIEASETYNEKNLIPLEEDFIVGGSAGPAPGQIDDAGESINCRCRIFAMKPEDGQEVI